MRSITMRRLKIAMKVRARRFSRPTFYPSIRIQGNWLQDAGFDPGSTVYLFVESGKIVIRLEPENDTEAKAMQLLTALDDAA